MNGGAGRFCVRLGFECKNKCTYTSCQKGMLKKENNIDRRVGLGYYEVNGQSSENESGEAVNVHKNGKYGLYNTDKSFSGGRNA